MKHQQLEHGLAHKALPMDDIYKRAAGFQIEFPGIATLKACHDGVCRVLSEFDIADERLFNADERALIKNTIGFISPDAGQCTISNAVTMFILFYVAVTDTPVSNECDDDIQPKLDLSSFVGIINESQLGAAAVVSSVIITAYARVTKANVDLWKLADFNVSNAFKLVSLRVREGNIARVRYHAQKAANASHDVHRSNKQKARDWYAEHKTMTKDAAAAKMEKDGIVHAAWRTIRGYLNGQ